MKKILIGLAVLVAAGIALAQVPMSQHGMAPTPPQMSAQATRACMFPAGGWTIINCSNVAAASSAALKAWSRYVVQCTDDSYIATGTAATGQDADANDGYLPDGAWVEAMTSDTVLYISCLNINSDADCRYIECQ